MRQIAVFLLYGLASLGALATAFVGLAMVIELPEKGILALVRKLRRPRPKPTEPPPVPSGAVQPRPRHHDSFDEPA